MTFMDTDLSSKVESNLKKLYLTLQTLMCENDFNAIRSQLLDITYGNYKAVTSAILTKLQLQLNSDEVTTSVQNLSFLISGISKDISQAIEREYEKTADEMKDDFDSFEVQCNITNEIKELVGNYHYVSDGLI